MYIDHELCLQVPSPVNFECETNRFPKHAVMVGGSGCTLTDFLPIRSIVNRPKELGPSKGNLKMLKLSFRRSSLPPASL